MQTGRESVRCREIPKSCDKIPISYVLRTDEENLSLYAKIQLSLRQILISILKMKAGVLADLDPPL